MTTYCGPQHDAVVALVERARRLTGGEAHRLAAAWDAAETAAQDAARAAARDAAWDAGDAARAATGTAARYAGDAAGAAWAAEAAARYAALALATRHLIGQGGYTAEHYAILTSPWRTVIGPIHPDDPAPPAP